MNISKVLKFGVGGGLLVGAVSLLFVGGTMAYDYITHSDFYLYATYKHQAELSKDEVIETATCNEVTWTVTHSDVAMKGYWHLGGEKIKPQLRDVYTLAGYIGDEKILWFNPGVFTPEGYASANVKEIDSRGGRVTMKDTLPLEQFEALHTCYKAHTETLSKALHADITTFVRASF